MRAFVGVATPGLAGPGLRERPEAPIHLTLAFLGEVPDAAEPAIADALRSAVAPLAAFDLVVAGTGAFPDAERPRIVYAAVTDGASALEHLAGAVRRGLDAAGVPFDRKPFRPHLTILRVRGPADLARARTWLADPGTPRFGEVAVTEVLLVASELTSHGPIHRVRARAPLGGERPAPASRAP